MTTVDEIITSATAIVQGLITADARRTMAGKTRQEMKDQAMSAFNGAMPTVKGCIEAITTDPRVLEQNDPDCLAMQAISLAALGTAIGSTPPRRAKK